MLLNCLLTIFLGLLVGFFLLIYRHRTYWREKGIPYINTFPILGIFGSVFLRQKSIVQVTTDCYAACPGAKYFGCLDFSNPVIIVKDPEIIKDIGVKSFDFFPNHRSFIEEEFDPLLSRNVFSLRDDRWRSMRMTLSPSFTANKMKFLFQLVSKCSSDFVQHLKDHPELTAELDMKDAYTRYTNDVIATSAFGISVNSMKDLDNEFYVNGLDASNFDGGVKLFKFVAARIAPKFMRFIGQTFLSKRADKFFKSLIYETIKTREEEGIVRPDMIHLLMQAKNSELGGEMTTEDIIAQAFIFFLAGFDTSSRLMCFISHVLAYHPDVQSRLRREVDDVLEQDGGIVSYETLGKMKYMDMVVSETLRLYPPMPFTDRVCVKPYTLEPPVEGAKSFTVQPDTSVWFPLFGFHRDPLFFKDPETFDPERFNDENKNNIKPYTYMPFGFGPRKCIGERFALMETKILITHLLHNFVINVSPKTTKDIAFDTTKFNIVPVCGFWIRLEKRER